ncbi:MAG: ABC transporter substrate-binding protein [Brachybacterium sp.]|nr:ABC transporter substrate-binding protein [Brachybacterium sp.]
MRFTRRGAIGLAAGGVAAGTLAACGNGNGGGAGADGDVPPLTTFPQATNTFQRNFNPFAPSGLAGASGYVFEPLMISTPMQPGEQMPWLAESMEFNDDGTVITFTLRDDVTWSDGEAFDAEDVAFSFTMFAEHPATNAAARPIVEATVIDEHTVEVEFEYAQFAYQAAIGNYLMVPEHLWSDIDPVEDTIDDPVGTGPYVLDHFGDQIYTMTKREDYWNTDGFEVQEVQFPAHTGETLTTALQAGELDWAGGFISNIEDVFWNQDPDNNGSWFPGGGLVALLPNNEEEIFEDTTLRRAISLALDREQITEVAMQGYTPPAHPTGLPLPTYEEVIAPEHADATLEFDPEEANRILDEAGYERGDGGIRSTPDGERLSWTMEIPSGWVDWIDTSQLIEEQLAEIGIDLTAQGVAEEAYIEARGNGNFVITMGAVAVGNTPFDMYRAMMSSEYEVDEGSVVQNFARFYDDEADEALDAYASTEDEGEQQDALENLQQLMIDRMPLIGLFQAPNWFHYTTARWEGFPNEDDPYALGAPFSMPDRLLILQRLTPAQ